MMKDEKKTKAQLLEEIKSLQKEIKKLDVSKVRFNNINNELVRTRRKLDAILRSVPDIIYRLNPDGIITYISDAVRQYGYNPEELVGRHIFDFVHPEDRDKAKYHVNERRTGERKTKSFELRLLSRKKLFIPFEIKSKRVELEPVFVLEAEGMYSSETPSSDNFLGTLGVARDITERKQAEKSILNSRERYKKLFENSNDGIFFMAADKIIECNPRTVELFGGNEQDIIGKPIYQFSGRKQPDGKDSKEKISKIIETAYSGEYQNIEWCCCKYDGTQFDAQLSFTRVEIWGESHLLGFIHDITERKQLENQLRQSQKMEAIGSLAGGVAHDFNNLLTVIRGYSELLLSKLSEKDPLNVSVKQIDKAAERAESLTRQLLAFSRRQILKPSVIDLNGLIKEMEKMLKRIIGEDIDFITILDPNLGRIKADKGQIEQVIMNIVINSRDAMAEGGKLTVETQNTFLDETYVLKHPPVEKGPYVLLAISDSGIGMDQETEAHIFEPFFTTKETGKGTGLGLATVYGIVKQSGGFIWVYSEIGQGTTFKIYLPMVDEKDDLPEIKEISDPSLRGTETVLIVEDEEEVRALIYETLHLYGYHVLEAPHGDSALLICNTYKDKISIIITDIVMPKMSGKELVDRLLPNHPEIKVLYMSGYTDNAIVHKGVLEPSTQFIQKPFTPLTLLRKVREVLDSD
jgi:PAS domain S-box-containing protein